MIQTIAKSKRESDNEDALMPSEILKVSPKVKVMCDLELFMAQVP